MLHADNGYGYLSQLCAPALSPPVPFPSHHHRAAPNPLQTFHTVRVRSSIHSPTTSKMAGNARRISKEFSDITKSPLDGIIVTLPDPSNLSLWHVTLAGPPNTPYERGTFGIKVNLPAEYPFKAPVVTFATRIYHPNVTNDSEGNICISLLKPENWKPASKLAQVLVALRQLLVEPNPDDPLEDRIAQEFRSDQAEFKKHAREYVDRYARKQDPFGSS